MKSLWDAQGYPNNVEDYRRFPVWLMEETLEGTLFLPVEVSDPLIYGEEDDMYADALLVFCAFQLRDGTHMEGVVTLIENWDSKLEQMCGFKEIRAKIFFGGEAFSIVRQRRKDRYHESLKEFAQQLGKSLDQITPMSWETPYHIRILDDQRADNIAAEFPLLGQIDLLTW